MSRWRPRLSPITGPSRSSRRFRIRSGRRIATSLGPRISSGDAVDSETRYELLDQVAPLTDVRWFGPGEDRGADLKPDRLNVFLDADDVITAVSCG